MSLHYNRDGSVTMMSDTDRAASERLPAGRTQDEVNAAYATFKVAHPPPPRTIYEPGAFIDLFTASEQAGMAAALPTHPALFVWYSKMLSAAQVDVTAADTVAGLGALAAAGVITPARAAQIAAGA
jgi:hypothetical protein